MSSLLSFKEYLTTKQVLVEALSKTAKTTNRYVLKTYCKIPVIDLDNEQIIERTEISLKPKQILILECSWPTYQTPLIHSISFQNVKAVDVNKKYMLPWKNEKILKWLDKNTTSDSWLSKINSMVEEEEQKNDLEV